MAKLHDFDQSGVYDLIVVDTPPTAHALDFLDAPRKLSEAIDSPAIDWFRKLQGEGGSRWSLVGAPAIAMPTGLGPSVLPLGLQLVGAPGDDDRLLRAAAWVEALLPSIGLPPI